MRRNKERKKDLEKEDKVVKCKSCKNIQAPALSKKTDLIK